MLPIEISHVVAVTAFIRNDDGRVLLVRSPQRDWEMPGGQVQRGECLVDALHRGVLEEAGIVIAIERLGRVYQNLEKSVLILAFVARATGGSLRTSEEGIEVGWYAEQEVAGNGGDNYNASNGRLM